MKASELRIGNYCLRLDNTVFTISRNDIAQIDDFPIELRPKPIPLTEEWLIRFGFEKQMAWYHIEVLKSSFYLRPSYLGGFYWGFDDQHELNDAQPIQYVHQLQNLYHAFTQTELTLSNP
jgi:hypothetical protein